MDTQEYKAWAKFQMENAGHWTVDPVHNGLDQDLIAYVAKPSDPTSGIYVSVTKDGHWDVGRFSLAIPHMGEAFYQPTKSGKAEDYGKALNQLVEILGLHFLLSLVMGKSPYLES